MYDVAIRLRALLSRNGNVHIRVLDKILPSLPRSRLSRSTVSLPHAVVSRRCQSSITSAFAPVDNEKHLSSRFGNFFGEADDSASSLGYDEASVGKPIDGRSRQQSQRQTSSLLSTRNDADFRPLAGRLPLLLQQSGNREYPQTQEETGSRLYSKPDAEGTFITPDASRKKWANYNDYEALDVDGLSTPDVYEKLHIMASRGGSVARVWQLCRYLIQERDQQPNLRLFSALLLSNVDASHGSARMIHSILDEMQELDFELDGAACHELLKALSVHPDYVLICEVIGFMQQRWIDLRSDGHHDVIAGLLRSAQYELALEKIDRMRFEGLTIQPWLYDLVMYHLSLHGEQDEILELLEHRAEEGDITISATMWNLLIENAARSRRHDICQYIWSRRVTTGYLAPNNGTCMQILATAAHVGDSSLAAEVFSLLGERGMIYQHDHYELLVESYATTGDMHGAFSVLCVMQETGIAPKETATRSICTKFAADEELRHEAFHILQRLREREHRDVPLAAVNVIIEAHVAAQQLSQAIEVYKALKSVVPSGADASTFHLLYRCCAEAKHDRRDLALELASEMSILRIAPDRQTYQHLIDVCSKSDREGLIDAFHYALEAKQLGLYLTWEKAHRLCYQLAVNGLQEAWSLSEQLGDSGYSPAQMDKTRAMVGEAFRQSKELLDETKPVELATLDAYPPHIVAEDPQHDSGPQRRPLREAPNLISNWKSVNPDLPFDEAEAMKEVQHRVKSATIVSQQAKKESMIPNFQPEELEERDFQQFGTSSAESLKQDDIDGTRHEFTTDAQGLQRHLIDEATNLILMEGVTDNESTSDEIETSVWTPAVDAYEQSLRAVEFSHIDGIGSRNSTNVRTNVESSPRSGPSAVTLSQSALDKSSAAVAKLMRYYNIDSGDRNRQQDHSSSNSSRSRLAEDIGRISRTIEFKLLQHLRRTLHSLSHLPSQILLLDKAVGLQVRLTQQKLHRIRKSLPVSRIQRIQQIESRLLQFDKTVTWLNSRIQSVSIPTKQKRLIASRREGEVRVARMEERISSMKTAFQRIRKMHRVLPPEQGLSSLLAMRTTNIADIRTELSLLARQIETRASGSEGFSMRFVVPYGHDNMHKQGWELKTAETLRAVDV